MNKKLPMWLDLLVTLVSTDPEADPAMESAAYDSVRSSHPRVLILG